MFRVTFQEKLVKGDTDVGENCLINNLFLSWHLKKLPKFNYVFRYLVVLSSSQNCQPTGGLTLFKKTRVFLTYVLSVCPENRSRELFYYVSSEQCSVFLWPSRYLLVSCESMLFNKGIPLFPGAFICSFWKA